MSDILNRYNASTKPRVIEARDAASEAKEVNYFDMENKFQKGWTNNQPVRETTYTETAEQYYTDELSDMVTPQSFNKLEPDIPLNRYNPEEGYYNPGSPQS